MTNTLRGVRVRLTVWYAGSSIVILVLLGSALLWVAARRAEAELDRSLQEAVSAAVQAARMRTNTGEPPDRAAEDAVGVIATPGRILYLFDSAGLAVVPNARVHPAIAEAAIRTFQRGVLMEAFDSGEQHWRLFGQRFQLRSRVFVVIALADAAVDRRQLRRIIETFIATGVFAALLAALGGWVLSGVSAAPIEQAFEERQRFMAEAAHELRTPLAVLRGQADVALARAGDPAADRAALGHIAAEAGRMARIVDDLFTLARADAGERTVRNEKLFLDDVASDAVSAARPLAQASGIDLDIGRYEEAALSGDPDRVRQLVSILIDNALKYTPAGGRVRVEAFREPDGRARLVVADTGPGIAAEDLPRVFDRFYRGAGTKGSVAGAGLGLPIAKWIAEGHGATLDIDTAPGAGTRVVVTFPSPAGPGSRG